MNTEIITITPEMANEMLSLNMEHNRRLNKDTVRKYARIMRGGGWNLTHQGIAFDTEGHLVDGQHRLHAIVSANVPVEMMVTRGVEHREGEAFSIDVGARRTLTNIMQISGIEDAVYKNMGKVITAYYRWKKPGGYRPEPVEIIDYIDRHYEDIAELHDIMGGTAHARASGRHINGFVGAAMLSAMYRGVDKDALRAFVKVYRYNDVSGCERFNAKHALNIRDYVRDHRDSAEGFARVESAISAFVENKAQLYVRENRYPFNTEFDS